MRPLGIRARVLVVAMLPAALVAVLLSLILLDRYTTMLEEGLRSRAVVQARQLAGTSEFAVFAGSRELLQSIAQGAQAGDPDILAISIFDARGDLLAATGITTLPGGRPAAFTPTEQLASRGNALVVQVPIRRTRLSVDDIYSGLEAGRVAPPPGDGAQVDGHIVAEFSRAHHDADRRQQLLIQVLIVLGGLLLAAILAQRISRQITRPILHMTSVVDRIGQGDLEARVAPDTAGAMTSLETGINRMAQRVAVTRDFLLREIESATAELRERTEEAEGANAAKSRFLAAASHDLRQPLHAMGLFVSRLGQMPQTSEMAPLVQQIENSVRLLQDLLDTLLDVSRLDAGLVVPRPSSFPVADILERIALEFAGPAQEKGLRLRVRPNSLWLRTDPQLLARIVMNFASNALRYTASGGVLLAVRRRKERAVLCVWDTGIGIPEHQRQVIFNEYVQLDNPARAHGHGLGLGLAICDRLSQLLALPMGVRSIEGRGSMFWVEIPLAVPGKHLEVQDSAAVAGISGVVAVLEDDPNVAAGLIGLLGGWGCGAVAGATLEEVVEQCDADGIRPDAIIADYHLGGTANGVDAALALRRRYGEIPVLLTSGSAGPGLIKGAEARGFIELTKPVRPGKLRAVLQSMLAGHAGGDATDATG